MLIADYVRKDIPPGSYSWRFIEDSVNNGIIQLKDRYLIGRHHDEPRPVGSGQLSRSTRTKFSAEDDAKIAKWALDHPTEQKGNRIWQEYERIVSYDFQLIRIKLTTVESSAYCTVMAGSIYQEVAFTGPRCFGENGSRSKRRSQGK
jgi:hypothetical protein